MVSWMFVCRRDLVGGQIARLIYHSKSWNVQTRHVTVRTSSSVSFLACRIANAAADSPNFETQRTFEDLDLSKGLFGAKAEGRGSRNALGDPSL